MSGTSSISSVRLGGRVEGFLEKTGITLGDPIVWANVNTERGIEAVGWGRCVAESITTRFGACRKAVRL